MTIHKYLKIRAKIQCIAHIFPTKKTHKRHETLKNQKNSRLTGIFLLEEASKEEVLF